MLLFIPSGLYTGLILLPGLRQLCSLELLSIKSEGETELCTQWMLSNVNWFFFSFSNNDSGFTDCNLCVCELESSRLFCLVVMEGRRASLTESFFFLFCLILLLHHCTPVSSSISRLLSPYLSSTYHLSIIYHLFISITYLYRLLHAYV